MAFGVALGNPFALLGEDEENDDPQKINLPHAAPTAVKEDQPPEGGVARGGRGRSERGRGARGGNRGGRGRSDYSHRGGEGFEAFEERPITHANSGVGRYGGPARAAEGRGRGGRGGKQRDFDRRDQSGRGHEVEKRGGGGKGNWGGAADSWEEIPAEESQPLQNGAQPPAGEQPADEYVKDAGAEVPAEPEEKEEVKLTLAEYEEMRKQKLLTKVVKKAEVDMGQFKGLSKFVKDDVETGFEALELEKTKKMKQKAKKEFIPVETGFRVGDPVRRGRGRGGPGRGGGRGSRDLDREGSGGSFGLADTSDTNTPYNAGGSGGGGSGGYRGRGRGRGWDRRPGSYGGGGYRDIASQPKQPSLDDQASFPSLA